MARPGWLISALRDRWWVARVLMLPVQLALFALVVFVLVRAIPGDPVLTVLGTQFTPALYARTKHALGLDGSFATQLGHYYGNLIHLNLGQFDHQRPAGDDRTRHPAARHPELALLGHGRGDGLLRRRLLHRSDAPGQHPGQDHPRLHDDGAIPEFCVGLALICSSSTPNCTGLRRRWAASTRGSPSRPRSPTSRCWTRCSKVTGRSPGRCSSTSCCRSPWR